MVMGNQYPYVSFRRRIQDHITDLKTPVHSCIQLITPFNTKSSFPQIA